MKRLTILLCLLAGVLLTQAQPVARDASDLQSGPMVGYSEMREVMLWVQTKTAAEVEVRYGEKGSPKNMRTNSVQTEKVGAFTAHLLADEVMPGKVYEGELYINGKQVSLGYPFEFQSQTLWQFRTEPPNFSFLAGSCVFINEPKLDRPGKPYGGDYGIFTQMAQVDADFMVWLGDNTYLRESDWNTRTGIMHRFTHNRAVPEMQPLLAKMHHYAIWDDHDFGPNDADRSYLLKETTQEAFELFWANPSYGLPGQGGITSKFQWADCDFFLLDNRYFRSPNYRKTGERTQLGEVQYQWLIDALKGSKATFKFVCIGGMVLSTYDKFENYIHVHPEERIRLMDAIQNEGIKGLIFLTGDRHHTELSYWAPEDGVPVYDFTVSPLTSGAYDDGPEDNDFLVEGTSVGVRNFATIDVTGPRKDRRVTLKVTDWQGKELWKREISENEWKTEKK